MKSYNPLEKEIEKKVCEYAKSKGVLCYKFTSPNQRSVPDRIFHFKGHTWYIEFKRLGQEPTAAQSIEIARIRAQGISVTVVDNVEHGKAIVDLEAR